MQDRELALVFLEPVLYKSVKLNLMKNKAHRAWCGFKHLTVFMYSRSYDQ